MPGSTPVPSGSDACAEALAIAENADEPWPRWKFGVDSYNGTSDGIRWREFSETNLDQPARPRIGDTMRWDKWLRERGWE